MTPSRRVVTWYWQGHSIARQTGSCGAVHVSSSPVDRTARAMSLRAYSKLGTKRAIEVGYIAEPAVEGDVDDLRPRSRQLHRGLTQPRPAHILMRRQTGHPLEC